jgi:predicted ATPase
MVGIRFADFSPSTSRHPASCDDSYHTAVTFFAHMDVRHHVVITGGPGAGKTTLLAELAAMGYATVNESARSIIAERLARGEPPRPDPLAFAQEILRRDIQKYTQQQRSDVWVFFDRSAVESIGMVHEASRLPGEELDALLDSYRFHKLVFVLPPWEAIYVTDAERDHSFAHATRVHAQLVDWYRACGYALHEVPRLPAPERAQHVMQVLSQPDS